MNHHDNGPWKVFAQYPDGVRTLMGVGFPTKEECQKACDELKAGKNGQEGATYEPHIDLKWSGT